MSCCLTSFRCCQLESAALRTPNGSARVEIHVAVALRILAGISYIDVAVKHGIAKETVYHILWEGVDAVNNMKEVSPFFLPRTLNGRRVHAARFEVGHCEWYQGHPLCGVEGTLWQTLPLFEEPRVFLDRIGGFRGQ